MNANVNVVEMAGPQVPPTVLEQIIKQAEASYPGDYTTQAYVIKSQVRAYIAISVLKGMR